ncbi:MAG: redox-sensing transcriptional repressor Rex [Treponema sp.]|jgi:redox-sensing transcriptional repressor|nr:redox-sensing transcriptional repressor Rex [Treponema sp.]
MATQKIAAVPSVRRLPSYLHIIRQAQRKGSYYISGTFIAKELNLEPIQVRKDLSITRIIGKPKKGYPVVPLINAIERFLGWDTIREAVLVGAGNLGTALLGYQELQRHGFRVVAAFDVNPEKIGSRIHEVPVFAVELMKSTILTLGVKTALLTVPSGSAQGITEILIKAGIEGIWNFTNVKLKVPDTVVVQKEDISSGYALFCVMMKTQHKAAQKPLSPVQEP